MSQRSEKYARSLLRRVEALEAHQLDNDVFASTLQSLDAQYERSTARWRKRAREAERSVQIWRWMCWTAVAMVLVIVVLLCLTTPAGGAEADEPAVVAQVIPEPMEEPENERIEAALLSRATVIEDCMVTHYDPCSACCGKTDGITASGVKAVPGVTVAVDPEVIPLGSDVLVDYGDGEIHYYRADDVGGAVRGNHIDLCVKDHDTALQLGVRTATVYWVEHDQQITGAAAGKGGLADGISHLPGLRGGD